MPAAPGDMARATWFATCRRRRPPRTPQPTGEGADEGPHAPAAGESCAGGLPRRVGWQRKAQAHTQPVGSSVVAPAEGQRWKGVRTVLRGLPAFGPTTCAMWITAVLEVLLSISSVRCGSQRTPRSSCLYHLCVLILQVKTPPGIGMYPSRGHEASPQSGLAGSGLQIVLQ